MTLLIAYILKCKTVCHLDALFMMQINSKDSLQNYFVFYKCDVSVPANIKILLLILLFAQIWVKRKARVQNKVLQSQDPPRTSMDQTSNRMGMSTAV